MIKQSLQLSTLTLAGSPTTLLRTQFSSTLESRNFSPLIADIYRRISLLLTKIQTYAANDNRLLKIDTIELTEKDSTTANSTYPKVAVQWLNQALFFYQCFCLVDSEVLRNRHLRQCANLQAVKKLLAL